MQIRRFFLPSEQFRTGSLHLSGNEFREEIKHLHKVLRLGPGDLVELVNGRGQVARARIEQAHSSGVDFQIESITQTERTRPKVRLLQGLLKGPRMDWLVEKLTEVGVDEIQPVETEYSVVEAEQVERRMERWRRLAQAAAKQSASLYLPEILPALSFAKALEAIPDSTTLVYLHPDASAPILHSLLEEALAGSRTNLLVIACGPEGGFHPEEVLQFQKRAWRGAALGPSILRGETAGFLASAIAKQVLHALG